MSGDPVGWLDLVRTSPKQAQILVVDDDPQIRRAVSSAVGAMGHQFKTAGSAEEADNWLSSMEFDLVLLDIELPRMNGVEFLNWAQGKKPDLAVIMITGVADPEMAMTCLDRGARTYLVKPIDFEFLQRAVRDALSMHQLLKERNRLAGQRGG